MSCSFVALPHLQIFKLDFSDLFSKTPKLTAWSAVLAYSLVMIFDIGGPGRLVVACMQHIQALCQHIVYHRRCAEDSRQGYNRLGEQM